MEIDTKVRQIHSRSVSGPDGYCSSVDSRIRTGLRKRHQVLLRVTSKKTNTARLFFFFFMTDVKNSGWKVRVIISISGGMLFFLFWFHAAYFPIKVSSSSSSNQSSTVEVIKHTHT